jgi:hypothetical protein
MRPLKILSVILGIVFALAGVAFVTSGGFVLGGYTNLGNLRDSSGFFTTPSQTVGSYGFALTAPDINAQLGPRWEKWVPRYAKVTVRISGSSEMPAPLFIGVAPTSQVSKYLSGVARDRIKSIDLSAETVQYDHVDGLKMPGAPGEQSFWVAKVEGTGTQTLEWALEPGDWTVVIMNADASAPLAANMKMGARFGIVSTLIVGLTAAGCVLVAIGATLIALGARRRRGVPHQQPRGAWSDAAPQQTEWRAQQQEGWAPTAVSERPTAAQQWEWPASAQPTTYPAPPPAARPAGQSPRPVRQSPRPAPQSPAAPRPPQQPPRSNGHSEKPPRDPSAPPEWEL